MLACILGTYKIKINYTSKALRDLSLKIGLIAALGFLIWYVVDLPARYVPRELSIPYYLDFLPRWLLKFFGLTILLGIVSLILFDIRKNKRGILKIDTDKIIIESKQRCDIIQFEELIRITFIILPDSFQRYRAEFIYPDFTFKRVKFKNKEQFDMVMENIYEVAPDNFEITGSAFESMHK